MNPIDITVPLREGMDVWEGDPPYTRELFYSIPNGDSANVSKISLSAHAGTHIDAPYHYFDNGASIDQISSDILIGPCEVVEISDEKLINKQIPISSVPKIIKYPRILFKTANSMNSWKFNKESVALSLEAANHLANNHILLVGIDGFSIENFYGTGEVHKALLSKGIPILETIDLSHVQPGFYHLIALPIKITRCDAAPTRALLLPLKNDMSC